MSGTCGLLCFRALVPEHAHSHAHDEHHQREHAPDDPPGEPHRLVNMLMLVVLGEVQPDADRHQ
jgi:hypothetical protein